LGQTGGSTVADTTEGMLKPVMTCQVAVQCNWKGKGDKYAFSSSFLQEVICVRYIDTIFMLVKKRRGATDSCTNDVMSVPDGFYWRLNFKNTVNIWRGWQE